MKVNETSIKLPTPSKWASVRFNSTCTLVLYQLRHFFTAVFVYAQNLKHRQTLLQNGWTNTLTLKLQKPFCPHRIHLHLQKCCKIRKISDKTQALQSRLRTNMAPRSSWIQAPCKREQPEAIEIVHFDGQYRDNYTIVLNNMLFVAACKFNS